MNDKTYNGWTNYETWNANLWLTNDEGSYRFIEESAIEAVKYATKGYGSQTVREAATCDLESKLKELFEDQAACVDLSTNGWMADAINSYLGEVDWYELAEHYIDDFCDADLIAEIEQDWNS